MLFAGLPWVLAGGLLGVAPAGILAGLTGLVFALWETHSPYTVIAWALLGTLAGYLLQQSYRTPFFRLARHPIALPVLLALPFAILFLIENMLALAGGALNRLDFSVARLGMATLAWVVMLLIAALVGEVMYLLSPGWHRPRALRPSPIEASLENRITLLNGALLAALALTLVLSDWWVSGRAAQRMIRLRMESTAQLTAESVPLFLEAGQNLILQAAQPFLLALSPTEVPVALRRALRTIPFFRQLYLFNAKAEGIGGYPENDVFALHLTPEELAGLDLAMQGIPVQVYIVPAAAGETSVQLSFIAAVMDANEQPQGVLLGRTDLNINPFTQPVLRSLQSLSDLGGVGMLADERGNLIYHPDPARLQGKVTLAPGEEVVFGEGVALDGTRALVLQRPVIGQNWYVILQVPAQSVIGLAVQIAMPLLIVLLLATLVIVVLLRWVLRAVTASLRTLAIEANLIAQGNLDSPLMVDRADEVGQLGRAFEQMRVSLKARLDELNRLLETSRGMTSSLEVAEAAQPVLQAALAVGAVSARMVLYRAATVEEQEASPQRFGLGPHADRFAHLDQPLLERMQRQDRLALLTQERVEQVLRVPQPWPGTTFAVALRHENQFLGVLWVAYEHEQGLDEGDMRFLVTLAGQASLAVANAMLFQRAEVERQRLAAILASTPDPVLVTDQAARLILANPSAGEVFGFAPAQAVGQPISKVISNEALHALLRGEMPTDSPPEIQTDDGRTFLAAVSEVQAEGQARGRVCVLRDVSHLKELDRMKTEFVHTVSHDLRSPLTLMQGYASMLPMVGELNEQQKKYVKSIVRGIDNMTRLVNSLLDLGRIEAGVGLTVSLVPLVDLVQQVADDFRLRAEQKQIDFQIELPVGDAPVIRADPQLLRQALHNLVENAIKYTDQGGKVWLRVKMKPDRVRFEVEDTGIGIAPVDQPRLFEKFYRAKTRKGKRAQGSGLGLAIVKSIVELHSGQVGVKSTLGKGSTFYFELPMKPPEKK